MRKLLHSYEYKNARKSAVYSTTVLLAQISAGETLPVSHLAFEYFRKILQPDDVDAEFHDVQR